MPPTGKKHFHVINKVVPEVLVFLYKGFTDIRPVMLLTPIYAVFFGSQGCLSLAVGNLIMDIVSDSLRWSCIAGFAANFLGPFIIYWFWAHISKSPFSLKSAKKLLIHTMLIILAAFLETLIITPAVAIVYPSVDIRLFATTVMLNSSLFPMGFGIPLTILMQEELGFKAYNNKQS